MNTPPWYVITGGPCAGKTTLVNALQARGYRTVPEAARAYIDAKLAEGQTLADIRHDEVAFQHALLPMKIEAEQALSPEETVFFDRGMHDSIAYLELSGSMENPVLDEVLRGTSYRKAFILDQLPYTLDAARIEDAEEAKRIHEALAESYARYNIVLVQVPVMSVEERVAFVLQNL